MRFFYWLCGTTYAMAILTAITVNEITPQPWLGVAWGAMGSIYGLWIGARMVR